MAPLVQAPRGRWLVSLVGGIVTLGAVVALFRPAQPVVTFGSSGLKPAKPLVQMARATDSDLVLKAETQIRDLRPLFLPTEFNVSLPEPKREAGRTFLDKETMKFGFLEAELNIGRELPAVITLNDKTMESVTAKEFLDAEGVEAPLSGWGRGPVTLAPAPVSGGMLDVVSSATGHRVFARALPLEARPASNKPWSPLEMMATIDAAGLSAPLVITSSSGVEEIDAHYRNFLVRQYRIGERLPPGFYQIVVAP